MCEERSWDGQMRTFSQGSIMESAKVVSAHIFWRQRK
jgi:hypothetical protein